MADTVYEVVNIGDKSWRIEENGVRVFLFEGADQSLLVDTGFGSGDLKSVVAKLTQKPIIVVNTHADSDHTGCNNQFDKIYMHPAEFAHYDEQGPRSAETAPVQDGDILKLGGREFEVILIPGHTAGSIALFDRENRLLVAGDSVSAAPIFMFGAFRSFQAYIASLNRLSEISGNIDSIYPSHGPFPVGPELIEKLIGAAGLVMKGGVEGVSPPFDIPAKMYMTGGVGFFY